MSGFDAFVVFAEMRTGSNFLETNLNAFDQITCHGEAFNPHFIGYPNSTDILGFSQSDRDANPLGLLDAIRSRSGMEGFRYFHDHDPRILDAIIQDRRIAKIILTRNPLESYVSWKIAQSTGQWKLTQVDKRKSAKARFDEGEFNHHLQVLQDFQMTLMHEMQVTGQSAFYIGYEDLRSLDVINGLARFLGVRQQLERLDSSLKVQNPGAIQDKVSNLSEMHAALARMDRFDLARTPNFEPRRAAAIPNYVAGAKAPLLFMPIKGGPDLTVTRWMADLDGTGEDALRRTFTQKTLRQWKRQNKGHRSFTVLRHPVARAHHAFCKHIVGDGPATYSQIKLILIKRFGLPPETGDTAAGYDVAAHRDAFLAFVGFLEANLTGQTAVRVDGAWCTQAEALRGFGQFALPDRVIREAELSKELTEISASLGYQDVPDIGAPINDKPFALGSIYDDEIEEAVARVYQRDYMMFGFDRWSP